MACLTQKFADRLILRPSRHAVETSGKSRRKIAFRKGHLEAWTQRVGTHDPDEVDVFVLKFPGRAGHAERATYHPADYWTDLRAELWSINPPGYGGSWGNASLRNLADAARTAYQEMATVANGRPIVLMGNSLGTVTALYLAARFDVAGMILRNPPPLRELILGRYGWRSLWIGAWLIAQKVPRSICSIRNAQKCTCPAVFLSSRKDTTVAPIHQDRVIQAYGGSYRLLNMEDADHAGSLNLEEQREYQRHLQWLRDQVIPFRTAEDPSAVLSRDDASNANILQRVDSSDATIPEASSSNGGYRSRNHALPNTPGDSDVVSGQIGTWG